jgi:hypothetical protein
MIEIETVMLFVHYVRLFVKYFGDVYLQLLAKAEANCVLYLF